MEEATFEKKIADLIEELRDVPSLFDSGPIMATGRKKATSKKGLKTAQSVQNAMDFLRISVKYLLFDLEATRRENAALRRRLDERS